MTSTVPSVATGSTAGEAAGVGVGAGEQPRTLAVVAVRLRRLADALAWASIGLGFVVLVGYAVRSERIVQLWPSFPPMYPNAAIALIAAGATVVGLGRDRLGRWVASVGVSVLWVIALAGLWRNARAAPRGWYEALFPTGFVSATTPVGGRPVAESCTAFLLIAAALTAHLFRQVPRVAQALAGGAVAVAASATLGFATGVDRRSLGTTMFGGVGMALHTALGIGMVAVAALLVRPAVGLVAHFLDVGVGGRLSRRTATVAACIPVALTLVGAAMGRIVTDLSFTRSVMSVVEAAFLGALVLVPAASIARAERTVREEQRRLRRSAESSTEADVLVEEFAAVSMSADLSLDGWELGFRSEPAFGHLAGDSIQLLARPDSDDRLLVVFDIAGHGAESAILAYGLRAHVAALWEQGVGLAELARSAGDKLLRRRSIATGVFVRIGSDGTTELVNAGHPPVLHLHGGRVTSWGPTGPLLGLRGATWSTCGEVVERGDVLFVCTDGLLEARPVGGGPAGHLGEGAVRNLVLTHRLESAQSIADACIDTALHHGKGGLRDDTLALVMRRTGGR